jgi:hypothetical protein
MRKKFGKEMFNSAYANKVSHKARPHLHDNSLELVDILNEHKAIKDNINIFEIGSSGYRNLYYIWKENNNVNLFACDLYKSVKNHAHGDVKDLVELHVGDASELLPSLDLESKINLFISSDVLMHIEYDKAKIILESIRDKYKPEFIILRERKKEFDNYEDENAEYPKLYHNYNEVLGTEYDLVCDRDSKTQKEEVFVRLFKRKKAVIKPKKVKKSKKTKKKKIEETIQVYSIIQEINKID